MTEAALSPSSKAMLGLRDQVIEEWCNQVRAKLCKAEELPEPILLNTLPAFYERLARLLTPEYFVATGIDVDALAQEHGGERARLSSYDTTTLIREYQLFRQVLSVQLRKGGVQLTHEQHEAMDTSIDSAIRESVTAFALVQSALREQFIAALTHDLRTPLSSISMAAQVMETRADNEDIRKLAGRIVENAKRIDGMTRDLLDCIVFEGGGRLPLKLAEFDMAELAWEVGQETMEVQHVTVEIKFISVRGTWCRQSLKRALENLLGNAIKYGAAGRPIQLSVSQCNSRVQVEVHNEGDPIPPTEIESIFQVYRRASGGKRAQDGWGVGLPYARRVAESHGGSIVVTSSIADGTAFIIDLPLDARPFSNAPVL